METQDSTRHLSFLWSQTGCIVINYSILCSLMQTHEHSLTHTHTHTQGSLLWRKISVCWTELKWQRGVNCTLSTLLWEKVNVKYLACLYYQEILQLGFPRQLFCWKRFVCAHMLPSRWIHHVFVNSFKTVFIPNMFNLRNVKCNKNAFLEKNNETQMRHLLSVKG